MTQGFHKPNNLEHHREGVRNALNTRNYKYIEDDFPSGTTPLQIEHGGDEMWVHGTCPYHDPCKCCGEFKVHPTEIVVAIDGGCRGNGTPQARAAVAVYFGPGNMHNFIGRLDYDANPTSQKAELTAAIKAIEIIQRIRNEEPKLIDAKYVVIKTDSAYLVNSMTQYIHKWKRNNYRTAHGQPVKNREFFEHIDGLIGEFKRKTDIDILFWHVRREYNDIADEMVNVAFNHSIASPKVYVVIQQQNVYSWFTEHYASLIKRLEERATITYVRQARGLDRLVEGPNTRFFLADDSIVISKNRQHMVDFVTAVRQKGSRIVIGGLFPTLAPWADIGTLFGDIFGLPWRIASYTKDDLRLNHRNPTFSTEGLIANEWAKTLFIKNVSARDTVYAAVNMEEAFAACTSLGQGFVGYAGDVNCGELVTRAIIAMLGLPPVDMERPFRLMTRATKIKRGYGDAFIDRSDVYF